MRIALPILIVLLAGLGVGYAAFGRGDALDDLKIPEVATEYHTLLDEAEGRVHARVTVAREFDAATKDAMAAALGKALSKTVVPHVTVDPRILGGVVVRVGEQVFIVERLRQQALNKQLDSDVMIGWNARDSILVGD